jgi:hypothetical protein
MFRGFDGFARYPAPEYERAVLGMLPLRGCGVSLATAWAVGRILTIFSIQEFIRYG